MKYQTREQHKVEATDTIPAELSEILAPEALEFLAQLHVRFEHERRTLLRRRQERQKAIDAGEFPDFLPETQWIRDSEWHAAPVVVDLADRRVEITGPVDRKMVINALNSGANCFMADFEDSNSPTWMNNLSGQANLRDAVLGTIEYMSPDGRSYKLGERVATLLVRPRGWHLIEKHLLVDGEPISGSLFDFGLYFFHNAKLLLTKGSGPYFYLPKMQSHLEARLWNDIFVFAQDYLGIARGSIRATVLIETILAAFEMDEILYELREHSAGLNCGRWDYIFSFIKTFAKFSDFVLPDRSEVTMEKHFLKSYVELLIHTCHRRGVHAMGGMAAQIPIKADAEANAKAFEKVQKDKLREVLAGHDGTWVAHPGLVPLAKDIFDSHMKEPNQIAKKREDIRVVAGDLLKAPVGAITYDGLRLNIDVGIRYIEAWLRGSGCVPIYNLMEDAATAEISRMQVWQWRRFGAICSDGRKIASELIRETITSQIQTIRESIGDQAFTQTRFEEAARLFERLSIADEPIEFMTLYAYDLL
ncbi:MAG TPA: malate synthase A [Terracidiphilus sp.]|nr:malate synthase A [Terracidiphilus sp.]